MERPPDGAILASDIDGILIDVWRERRERGD